MPDLNIQSPATKGIGAALVVAGGSAFIIAVVLATTVVMLMKQPRTRKEWVIALISTVVSSLGLGSGVALHFGMHLHLLSADAFEVYLGLLKIAGTVFASGLPGWVLVRIAFNTMNKHEGSTVEDLVDEIKEFKS